MDMQSKRILYLKYTFKLQKIVDLKAQESEWMDVIKEMYPALASSMGLFVEEEEKIFFRHCKSS